MCGRYALYGPVSRLKEKLVLAECPEYFERYNISPQSNILVIRQKDGVGRVGQMVKWGLIPSWAKDTGIGNKLTNARGETVAEKPSFRSAFSRHRCLIPANGFYEWQKIEEDGKVRKQPYYIHPKDTEDFFAIAGLLSAWRSPEGETIVSSCIITTGPNEVMEPIHDRMPVILQPEHYGLWLDPENKDKDILQALIRPCSASIMEAYPVSPKINSGKIEGPECIEEIPNP